MKIVSKDPNFSNESSFFARCKNAQPYGHLQIMNVVDFFGDTLPRMGLTNLSCNGNQRLMIFGKLYFVPDGTISFLMNDSTKHEVPGGTRNGALGNYYPVRDSMLVAIGWRVA